MIAEVNQPEASVSGRMARRTTSFIEIVQVHACVNGKPLPIDPAGYLTQKKDRSISYFLGGKATFTECKLFAVEIAF